MQTTGQLKKLLSQLNQDKTKLQDSKSSGKAGWISLSPKALETQYKAHSMLLAMVTLLPELLLCKQARSCLAASLGSHKICLWKMTPPEICRQVTTRSLTAQELWFFCGTLLWGGFQVFSQASEVQCDIVGGW